MRNTRIRTAQTGLENALKEAQKEGAHVIITVGSYLNRTHDDESLIRQQFPIKLLKNIAKDQKIHLIHIDPAFKGSEDHPAAQYHDGPGWELSQQDQTGLVKTYINDNFKITTIAQEIVNSEEGDAYFKAIGHPQSILNVDLGPYIQLATEEGRGFITGNFYDKSTDLLLL